MQIIECGMEKLGMYIDQHTKYNFTKTKNNTKLICNNDEYKPNRTVLELVVVEHL